MSSSSAASSKGVKAGKMSGQRLQVPNFAGHKVQLPLDAVCLHRKCKGDDSWPTFKSRFLQHVCAARNTPEARPNALLQLCRQDWWRLDIELTNARDNFDYIHEFCDRVDDQLSHLLSPKSCFSEAFLVFRDANRIMMDVASSKEDFATMDYKTALTTNKGLVTSSSSEMEIICHYLYKKKPMDFSIRERPPELQPPLGEMQTLNLSESARLQFKRWNTGSPGNRNRTNRMAQDEGMRYVEKIWCDYSRSLGEYVSCFSKIERGGAIYYGIAERDGHTGYAPEGLPLNDGMVEAIKEGLCHRIRHDMLWIQRDPGSSDGYKELKPDDIRCQATPDQDQCHFAVDFIKVQDRRSGESKYVLEVRVAPFNGVVFYDPKGPESYRMQEEGGQCQPVRVRKGEWLDKIREYGWCSKHKISKETLCA